MPHAIPLRSTRVWVLLATLAACTAPGTTDPTQSPATLTGEGGGGQVGPVGAPLATPLKVRARDDDGDPIAGVAVAWSTASGSVAPDTVLTDALGLATAVWTLGGTPGAAQATAKVVGLPPANFTATATAGPLATLQLSRDSLRLDQWGDTGGVQVTGEDAFGNVASVAGAVWTAADTTVARVTGGMVRSVRAGLTTVRVSVGGLAAELPVRVVTQRNASCVAPGAPVRGGAAAIPSYAAVQILDSLASPAWNGSRTIAVDYDGDGDQDAVRLEYSFPSSDPYGGTVHVFKNDGGVLRDSSAAVLTSALVPDHPRDFEVADFSGDGTPDLYVAQHGYDAPPFPGAPNLFLTRAGANIANSAAARFAGSGSTAFSHGSSAGDVDCDGDLDIVELNLNSSAPNILWLNNGAGQFTAASVAAFPIGNGAAGQRWQEAAFIDFDSDGDADLFLGARSGDGWDQDAVYVNDGFGNFRTSSEVRLPAPRYAPHHAINNAKAADVDGDGRSDLILFEIPQPFSAVSAVRFWRNGGNGVFSDWSAAWGLPAECTGEVVEPLYVTDLNQDGWSDITMPPNCTTPLAGSGVYFNTGTGFQFLGSGTFAPWVQHDLVTPMDVNDDGKMDLFYGDRGGNPVVVRQQ